MTAATRAATRAAHAATRTMTVVRGGFPCMSPNLRQLMLLGRKPVPGTAHRLDQVEPELRPQPPHADVDHVGAGVEVVPPDRRQQLIFGDRMTSVPHELPEQQELQPRQGYGSLSDVGLQPADVEAELPGPEQLVALIAAQLDAHPGEQ